MRPLSCCGKNPLGTRMNRYAFSPMVANRTASVTARKRSATESVLPYRFTSQSKARSLVRYIQPWARFSFKRCAHIMGVAVSETTMETAMATDSVTANSRKRRPTMPPIRSRGMNTAISETLMVNTVELRGRIGFTCVAARVFAHANASPDGLLHPALAGLHVRTGNLHGELLSVHKISQAYPGVPTVGALADYVAGMRSRSRLGLELRLHQSEPRPGYPLGPERFPDGRQSLCHLHGTAGEQRGRRGRSRRPQRRRFHGLRHRVAFARSQKQVGIDAVLARVQIVVTALESVQGLVGAALHDAALFHHQNLLRAADGGEAMRDHEGGAPFHQVGETLLNGGLGFGIEAAGGLVENQDARIGENGAGDGDALALATGELDAALADDGVVLVVELFGELIDSGNSAGGQDLLLGGLGTGEADV